MKKGLLVAVLEIFLIAIVPLFTAGLDLFENTRLYDKLNNFDIVEETINLRFSVNYQSETNSTIFKDKETKLYNVFWKFIKSHTPTELRDETPFAISMLGISNPSRVALPYDAPDITLIPDSVPIVAVYYEYSPQKNSLIPGKDIIIIGTIADLKRWLSDDKRNLRIKVNTIISLISITCGLFLIFMEKNKAKKKSFKINFKKAHH